MTWSRGGCKSSKAAATVDSKWEIIAFNEDVHELTCVSMSTKWVYADDQSPWIRKRAQLKHGKRRHSRVIECVAVSSGHSAAVVNAHRASGRPENSSSSRFLRDSLFLTSSFFALPSSLALSSSVLAAKGLASYSVVHSETYSYPKDLTSITSLYTRVLST